MRILIAGGTGTAGRAIAERARAVGHEVVAVSRRPSQDPGHRVADLVTGEGLDAAMEGVDSVIDASNIETASQARATTFFSAVGERLVAAERRAGVRHHVVLSIVGIDRFPTGYYRAKLAQERVAAGAADRSGVGCTIARVTQFHDFAPLILRRMRVGPVAFVPRLHLRPVHLRDVASHLVEIAERAPAGRAADLGGPRAERLPDMIARYVAAAGIDVTVVPVPLPGRLARADREEALWPVGGRRGTLSFDSWLNESGGAATHV